LVVHDYGTAKTLNKELESLSRLSRRSPPFTNEFDTAVHSFSPNCGVNTGVVELFALIEDTLVSPGETFDSVEVNTEEGLLRNKDVQVERSPRDGAQSVYRTAGGQVVTGCLSVDNG
jgi:hypothetical protein